MRIITAKSMAWMAPLFLAAPAMAQSLHQLRDLCLPGPTPAVRIASCTAVIDSGKVRGADLASIFFYRGVVYNIQKDNARAISDFSQAIKINPQGTEAFLYRGFVYADRKDYGRAISDFDEAIRIDPQFMLAFLARSNVKHLLGKTIEGDADFARARAIASSRRP